MSSMLDAAIETARHGWRIHPLRPRAKTPLLDQWPEQATTDPETITAWWSRWPDANIAIATGARSGIIAIDIDEDDDGHQTWTEHENEHGTTSTLVSFTGKGRHLIYQHPGEHVEIRNSARKALGRGIDVRGDGGYIVAPPSIHPNGERYEWADLTIAPTPLPQWLHDRLVKPEPAPRDNTPPPGWQPNDSTTRYAARALEGRIAEVAAAPSGQRNHTLNDAAYRLGQLIAGGQIDQPTVEHELTQAALSAGLGAHEIAATIRSGITGGTTNPQYPDPDKMRPQRPTRAQRIAAPPITADIPPEPDDHDVELDDDHDRTLNVAVCVDRPETDLGNAERLIIRYGHELRYATHFADWLRWDGRRWAHDTTGHIHRATHDTIRHIHTEARWLDTDKAKKRIAHAHRSEQRPRIEAAIAIAAQLEAVAIGAEQLDADPWQLNVLNGTIDLRTGNLRPHDPADLITKLAPVIHDPAASYQPWDDFLHSAFAGDGDLIDWLQRAVGYTLTGDTSEEILLFAHGPTATGKSTFLDAIRYTLGDYARTADFETFLAREHVGNARPDIARLAGARCVVSSEVDDGKKLAEGLVKTLTGGDTITARYLFKDDFEYRPQFKLWLAANHRPRVRHDDSAIWRRIRLIPFVHPPARRDETLKDRLRSPAIAGPAILTWALQGCARWQQEGLHAPDAVRTATAAYQAAMDPLSEYLDDHTLFADDEWCTSNDLRSSYEQWAKDNGIRRPLSHDRFSEILEQRGAARGRRRIEGKTTRIWQGLRLRNEWEQPTELFSQPDATDATRIPATSAATDATRVPATSNTTSATDATHDPATLTPTEPSGNGTNTYPEEAAATDATDATQFPKSSLYARTHARAMRTREESFPQTPVASVASVARDTEHAPCIDCGTKLERPPNLPAGTRLRCATCYDLHRGGF